TRGHRRPPCERRIARLQRVARALVIARPTNAGSARATRADWRAAAAYGSAHPMTARVARLRQCPDALFRSRHARETRLRRRVAETWRTRRHGVPAREARIARLQHVATASIIARCTDAWAAGAGRADREAPATRRRARPVTRCIAR